MYTYNDESNLGNYKDMNKRMARDFKAFKKSCRQDQALPEADLVEQFSGIRKLCGPTRTGEKIFMNPF